MIDAAAWQARATEPSLESLSATRDRPLFSPSRRPPPPAAAAAAAAPNGGPASATPTIELSGVVLGPVEREAVFQRANEPMPQSVHVGGEIDGWKVTSIDARSITLSRSGRSINLQLPAPDQTENVMSPPQ